MSDPAKVNRGVLYFLLTPGLAIAIYWVSVYFPLAPTDTPSQTMFNWIAGGATIAWFAATLNVVVKMFVLWWTQRK